MKTKDPCDKDVQVNGYTNLDAMIVISKDPLNLNC